jgi:hypothetical protein
MLCASVSDSRRSLSDAADVAASDVHEIILFVKECIGSIPDYESHYTRRQNNEIKYLVSEFSMQLTYRLTFL